MDKYQQPSVFNGAIPSGDRAIAKNFLSNVFLWMFGALLVSAGFAALFTYTDLQSSLLGLNAEGRAVPNLLGWGVMLAPIGLVLLLNFGYHRLSAGAAAVVFVVYAAITGISLSFVLGNYTQGSVLACFLSSAAMFGVMAVMGYTTKKDLTGFGRIMIMGLVGIIIASLINLFLQSGTMSWIISLVGVAVFTGLTAYDVQKLKRIGAGLEFDGATVAESRKLSILGGLTLYLDFINLFLMLLRLFGGRRN